MWLTVPCASSGALRIQLPPGVYFAPRHYDLIRFEALVRLIRGAVGDAHDLLTLTWTQADHLEGLARLRGWHDGRAMMWALHGDVPPSMPESDTELKGWMARRFPCLQPQLTLVLDRRVPAARLGWFEAHIKLPLVSWIARSIGDEHHPLRAAAIDGLDVRAVGAMTSDPLELMGVIEDAIAHRLEEAFPRGLAATKQADHANVEARDWARSVRVAVAKRLARRVNTIPEDDRREAATRIIAKLSLAEQRRADAIDALVERSLAVPPTAMSDGLRDLARTVSTDPEAIVLFVDHVELPHDMRLTLRRELPQPSERSAAVSLSRDATASEAREEALTITREHLETLRQFEARRVADAELPERAARLLAELASAMIEAGQLDDAQRVLEGGLRAAPASGALLDGLATFLWRQRGNLQGAEVLFQRAVSAAPATADNLGNYANFLWQARRDLDRAQTTYERAIEAGPKQANNLGDYANFLWQARRDLDGAQAMYERAIEADSNDANNLGNYANFLWQARRDLDRAQTLYERAIEADPRHAFSLRNYAKFLRQERRDLDRAQAMYERAVEADPNDARSLGNYANFLWDERRDLDRAQTLYERAIRANPRHAVSLGNYAIFLCDERRDFDRAKALLLRAVLLAPDDPDHLGNLAHVLFQRGERDEGRARLREARRLPVTNTTLVCELPYYTAVHVPEEREEALTSLRSLIARGASSPGWNFRAHAELASASGDPDAPLLAALGEVLAGRAAASTLDAFPRWHRIPIHQGLPCARA